MTSAVLPAESLSASTRDDRVVLRFMATPADSAGGDLSVAAGSVMEWIDKAAYACAVGWAGTYCVTAYVGNMRHRRPIAPGSLIEVQARLIYTGRTSMHILATVLSADVETRQFAPATSCILIFVAKDAEGRPTPVAEWQPRSALDAELRRRALERLDSRAEIKRLMMHEDYTDASAAPRTVMRFLVPPAAVNWGGKAHGGTVMRWMDEAAYAVTVGWAAAALPEEASRAVGVYSGGIHFFSPVGIGDLIEIDARIVYTSARAVHVSTRVFTADPRRPQERTLTTMCLSVFVVPDGAGSALPLPQWQPQLPEDLRLHAHVQRIIELRGTIEPIPIDVALDD